MHWQSVALLLAGVTAGATVVLAGEPAALEGCDVAFTTPARAQAALDAGVDDVLALSGHPLGAPCGPLPALVSDYAREVPSYGDGWSGPRPTSVVVEVGGAPVQAQAGTGLTAADRVLFGAPLHTRGGAALLLAVLGAGASLVLLPDPGSVKVARVVVDEGATAAVAVPSVGLRSLG